jgi:hypothetical protein
MQNNPTPQPKTRAGQTAAPNLLRFQLLQTLSAGSSAQAKVLSWGGGGPSLMALTGLEITVYSAVGGFTGAIGDRGYCFFWPDATRFEAIAGAGGAKIVRFRTTGTLTLGSSTPAVMVNEIDEEDVDGDEITVVDWSAPGTWYGPTGSQGIACKIPDRDNYDILWMEHPSLFVVAIATAVMTAGVLPVTVTSSWDGAGPLTATDIYDVAGNYASAAPGDQFIARLDPATSTYKIIDGPPSGNGLIRFQLYGALIEGLSAEANPVLWDGANWVANPDALFTVWDSEYLGPAVVLTRGWCRYSSDSARYEIVSLGDELIRFQLTEAIGQGGNGEANPIVSDGVAWTRDDGVTFSVYDSLQFGPMNEDATGWAVYKPDSGRYEIVVFSLDIPKIGWFVATDNHTLDIVDFSIDHFVNGIVCADSTGAGAGGPTLRFYLPCPSDAMCPNVKEDAVLPYVTDKYGRRVAVGSFLDAYRGASRQHIGPEATIPFGWHLCDGSNGTPDLRRQFLLMANGDAPLDPDFDGRGNGDEIGANGGSHVHNHQDQMNQEGDEPGTLHHYSNLDRDMTTDDTELLLQSSPGMTVTTSATSLSVDGTATTTGGYTNYGLAYPSIVCEGGASNHEPHCHVMTTGWGADGLACSTGDKEFDYFGDNFRILWTGPTAHIPTDPCDSPVTFFQTHLIIEPNVTYNPYTPGSDDYLYIAGGGHGHRHQIGALDLTIDAEVDPDPHTHEVTVSSIVSGMWIIDNTHYGDDATHYNFHYHDFEVDDHQLLVANHIPPYYALAQIMRVN